MTKSNPKFSAVVLIAAISTSSPVLAQEAVRSTIPQPLKAETTVADLESSSVGKPLLTAKDALTAQNITSVSQLSDVQPTDWAFTALQSLVERYGCIAGYPDRTFKGARSTTRYEFAAGLNACLDKINELISAGLADKVSKEDLAALQKLQEEFAAELALLRGRVDALEVKTARLEAQQFSTTTKLSGEVIMAITGGGNGGNPVYSSDTNVFNLTVPADFTRSGDTPAGVLNPPTSGRVTAGNGNANTNVAGRVRLDFNTSFTGSDLLLTRLEAGTGGGFLNTSSKDFRGAQLLTSNFGNAGLATFAPEYAGVPNTVQLTTLRYDFNVGSDIRVSVGPAIHFYDYVDKNSYANNEADDFSTTFFLNNPLVALVNLRTGVPGAAVDWNPGKGAFSVRAVYLAAKGNEADTGPINPNFTGPGSVPPQPPLINNRGLFGNPYQIIGEIEFAPKDSNNAKGPFAIRLQYTQGYYGNRNGSTGGVNVEWEFVKGAAIFGRYGFGTLTLSAGLPEASVNRFTNIQSSLDRSEVNFNPQTFAIGLAFPNLFKRGALAAIAVGQPFIESKVGNTTQTNLEFFYNFPISDNISITPDLAFVFNPNNNSFNSTITIATLRTVFKF